jgi:ADP-heptose:LPS heptosyltransferase
VLDSLRLVAGLDLLITVDTSWAHMAGALGVPCWVLLPFRELDWRWMRGVATTPWYRSLRLFRQAETGGWDPVLAQVEAALRERPPGADAAG